MIEVEGAQTPREEGTGKTSQGESPRRLPDRPQASEAPGTEINRIIDFLLLNKQKPLRNTKGFLSLLDSVT
ncbi:hypothetical protein B4U37_12865 [Sutcliffiella horikoshii]|uniref:Uncharacterized protein n=1 Tax=Sutcliffiella horikoshii TaxID=79883 RepID=A0ABM6KKB9_9BACI|nr:hypothetical protein B4U37_12865 [Sutcliffiella horikoshii]